ncbi:MAG TPA: hypothetical protein VK993_16145 [Chthoniobacterales bacterium]|nr:hypothetical protein [Chthoniobacterales bacterium]
MRGYDWLVPLQTVEGVYENGAIRLIGEPPAVDHASVLVTFLDRNAPIDLQSIGISAEHAAELRGRLRTFADDWNRPEMDAYDAL